MTASVRTIEPTTITTREEVHWTRTFSDYPATLWELNYYFRGPGDGFNAEWGVEVTADGDGFDIVVDAFTTAAVVVAGWYTWQAVVTEIADATNTIMIRSGRTKIVLGFDPAAVTTVETRTAAKIMLDTIDAALLVSAGSDTIEYEITTPAGSRRVKRQTRENALNNRKYWASIVSNENYKEKSRNGGGFGTKIDVRFYD